MLEEIMEAARSGDTGTLMLLLDKDPDMLQATMSNGESPLIAALYYGKQAIVQFLLDSGVSVNIHEAAALGDEMTLDYMLNMAPALISEYSFDGWTPLHLACFFGGYEAAQLLINREADVNMRSQNSLHNMPIHTAVAGKRTGIVQLLLEHGADPNVQQHDGVTPIQQAVINYDLSMVELLLQFGADPHLPQNEHKSAWMIAADKGYDEIVSILQRSSSGSEQAE